MTSCLIRYTGAAIGRTMHRVSRNRDAMLLIGLTMLPVAFTLLLAVVLAGAVGALDGLLFTAVSKKER